MAAVDPGDGSEDVTDFLRRIKELGDKRDQEDAERTKKLEEDIIEGRKQREARRAERARSISPEKSSPSTTPRSMRSPRPQAKPDFTSSPLNASSTPILSATIGSVMEKTSVPSDSDQVQNDLPPPPTSPSKVENGNPQRPGSPTKPPGTTSSPTRSGTLSWQQRPNSLRASKTLDLKTSSVERSKASPSAQEEKEEAPISRDQIAKSLGSKDPAWFRQTQERGIGSAAYRRNIQDTDTESSSAERRALHGLSNEPTPSMRREQDTLRSWSPMQPTSGVSNSLLGDAGAAQLPASSGALETKPDLPERPSSPTKVAGGFVQSAMLKRTESLNKRWSAQTPPTLHRQISNATAQEDVTNGGPQSLEGTTLVSKDSTNNPEEQVLHPTTSNGSIPLQQESDTFVKPAPPLHKRSQSSLSNRDTTFSKSGGDAPATSPSKRWSPQKASWLESALNRPESPTPKSPTRSSGHPQQPAWMVQLSREKQQRASRDILESSATGSDDKKLQTASDNDIPDVLNRSTSSASPPSTKPKPASLIDIVTDPAPKESEVKSATTLTSSPSLAKSRPKPITPPKKDFRSQLKSRPAPEKIEAEEPEFLNAFGKLKRTQTEKYVAPDELKNNILRGKSALAVTGGPQKTQRRDELKESLVQQREAMKVKAADSPAVAKQASLIATDIPEAIAKKQALDRNDSSGNIMSVAKTDKTSSQNASSEIDPLALGTSPASNASVEETLSQSRALPSSSKLATRFNPGLASVIARGPLANPDGNRSPTGSRELPTSGSPSIATSGMEPASKGGQLQHMTKARARGPKRRLPNAGTPTTKTESKTKNVPEPSSQLAELPVSKSVVGAKSPTLDSPDTGTQKETTTPKAQKPDPRSSAQPMERSPPVSKPTPPVKPLNIIPSPANAQDSIATLDTRTKAIAKPSPPIKSPQLNEGFQSPRLSGATSPSKGSPISNRASVKDAAALWGKSELPPQSPPPKSKVENVKLPKEESGLNHLKEIATGLIGPNSNFQTSQPGVKRAESPRNARTESPHRAKPLVDISSKDLNSPQPRSPKPTLIQPKPQISSSAGSGNELEEFFGDITITTTKLDVDVSAVLQADPHALDAKSKTIKKEVRELGSDGKISPVPPNQEHVLFSRQLYLCTHAFEDNSGARSTEVYLWAGSSVADAAIEDAQIFARRAAKDANGKLIIIRQGKETASFIQALGGIVITRTGSPKDNSNSFMLCGMQHLGHLAFDEVEISASRLCSGFVYIIAGGPDKVFLWRGAGCNHQELGAARLISMDLSASAVVTEVDEGKEPGDLMAILSPGRDAKSVPRSADHWKLKTKYDNYHSRLFNVGFNERPISRQDSGPAKFWNLVRRGSQADLSSSAGTQITEIAPFAQSDLRSDNIYVLDAFFELYIIVGSTAQTKQQAFASALLFAQEYATLAASSENRPYVPVATVVLEGAPRDMKRVFRQWDDTLMPTSKVVWGAGIKRGPSLRVLSLSQALGALNSQTKE